MPEQTGTGANGAAEIDLDDELDAMIPEWEHYAGGERQSMPTVYRMRWDEPPGWLVAVGSNTVFIADAPDDLIAAVLAQVVELVAASPAAVAAPAGPSRPPPPPNPRGRQGVPAGQGHGAPAGQARTFPGEQHWPGQVAVGGGGGGIPQYLADPVMRQQFAGGLAKRLAGRPPALSGWIPLMSIIGPQPPLRPGLWTLFPGMSGAPHADSGRMLDAARDVFGELGYTVENDHVWVGKPGQGGK